ncbi:MAG: hypothetical protein ACI8PZ_003066 [Myxococcota bacterium]|jgi:hypothetical protein
MHLVPPPAPRPEYDACVRILFPLPLLILLTTACEDGQKGRQSLGPAVIGVFLGNDTDLAGFLHLRSGKVVVVAAETALSGIDADATITGATVTAEVGPRAVIAPEIGDGLYETPDGASTSLYATVGDRVGLELVGDDRLGISAIVPPVLQLEIPLTAYPADEPMVVDFPKRWYDDYDQVLAQVYDEDGEMLWSNHPRNARGWLKVLSRSSIARKIELPKRILEPGETVVLAVTFLQQLDEDADLTGPLNEPASSFWAGTAWLLPIPVAP